MTKIHFPNLNGLRFFAAFFVIIGHIEFYKDFFSLPNIWGMPFTRNIGARSVHFFFTLSGFLITYILIAEKDEFNTIFVKNFYRRRILRILPLYYFIVILALFILPQFAFFQIPELSAELQRYFNLKAILFFFILPNILNVIFYQIKIQYAHVTWSIGVEEQFYMIWPWIIKKNKHLIEIFIALIIFLHLLKNGIWWRTYLSNINDYFELIEPRIFNLAIRILRDLIFTLDFEFMAIGAIASYILYYKKNNVLKIIFSQKMQLFFFLILGLMLILSLDAAKELYAFLFAILILNAAANPKSILKLENNILNYLGKISYGLYMYHTIVTVIVIRIFIYFQISLKGILNNVFLHLGVILLTIVISSISYEYFEKIFLDQKVKYLSKAE